MLKKISCDKLGCREIYFDKGLNVIAGDDIASNSIGKSTTLNIIDFVFGGSTYLKSDDIIVEVGHHEFLFEYEFGNEVYYFKRDTIEENTVYYCDHLFNIKFKKTATEFRQFLKLKYGCEASSLSFRDIIGVYSRVYGKGTINEKHPLQSHEKEPLKKSIERLVQLFGKYSDIKEQMQLISRLEKQQDVLKGGRKTKILQIPSNKTEYLNFKKSLEEKEHILSEIKKSLISDAGKGILTAEILKLQYEKEKLQVEERRIINQLSKLETTSLSEKSKVVAELSKFKEYFPNFDEQKIETINSFHTNLTRILKDEIALEKKELKVVLRDIADRLQFLNSDIEKLVSNISEGKIQDGLVSKLVEITSEIQILNQSIEMYDKQVNLKLNLEKTKENTAHLIKLKLAEIQDSINEKLEENDRKIYSVKNIHRSPTLELSETTYRLNTPKDNGTGRAFSAMISLDLAILKLTDLPILIHDLPMLKNIEDFVIENIFELYNESEKQIFVVIDKINSFSDEAQKIMNDRKVLQLTRDNVLYNKTWND